MRKPIIAGNWKMYKTLNESVDFVRELAPRLASYTGVERIVCPTFVALAAVADALKNTDIHVGAQNLHWEAQGAYTSQIAPTMLQGLAEYVIIGHSECRAYLHETDEDINRKVKAALAYGLKPILAVGESLAQNEAGETQTFVGGQVRAALAGIEADNMRNIVIAYEPIWAIGTGKNASGEVANAIIGGTIRSTLAQLYGNEIAQSVRIQYGGSVKPSNMLEYMSQPDIDGALVGGASLKVDDFVQLVESAAKAKGL
ncbi:MAG: triose-phosphate isomerase [Chloroflexi bacterium]|nr:triose-phosphate isomerase [Chloroflexota bacterium]MDL1883989.1 triose-phosphate isomerase [Anaerolineae bacterium CFX8]GIL13575.1 MAG: triosephosphate isomerase [Chloroflexota bacterium]